MAIYHLSTKPISRGQDRLVTACIGALSVVLSFHLVGCSETCTPEAAVGNYTMRSGSDVYELHLAKDWSGSLALNGNSSDITWEWANDQVFMHFGGELYDRLDEAMKPHFPKNSHHTKEGYFGLVPKCESGVATELGSSSDTPHFSRANDD